MEHGGDCAIIRGEKEISRVATCEERTFLADAAASVGAAELPGGTAPSSSVQAALLLAHRTDPDGGGLGAGSEDGQRVRDRHALRLSPDHLAARASQTSDSSAGTRAGGTSALLVAAAVVFAAFLIEDTVAVILAFVLTAQFAHRTRRWQRAASRLLVGSWN